MGRKLVAIDLDGTLLESSLTISPYSEKVIRALEKEGVIVVLASGRPYRAIRPYYEQLGLTSPVICYNGAMVFNPKDRSFPLYGKTFKAEDLRDIAKKMGEKLLSFMAETGEIIYMDQPDSYLDHFFPWKTEHCLFGDMEEIIQEDCYTAVFHCRNEDAPLLQKVVESHPDMKFRHWTANCYSEAYVEHIHKGSALSYIMDVMGLRREDCYGFGDSDNDYEMLELVGHGYAIQNSKSEFLKQRFPTTEKGNNHDGVALMLAKLFRLSI